MNKRYMDFVPTKASKMSVSSNRSNVTPKLSGASGYDRSATRSKSKSGPEIVYPKPRVRATDSKGRKNSTIPNTKRFTPARVDKEPTLGIVEDLNSKFVEADVSKRPLGNSKYADLGEREVLRAKAERVGARRMMRGKGKLVEKPVEKVKVEDKKEVFVPPKSPFINQAKVIKRPLSKNVYQKKVETPEEEPKGPVTIIAKPEKDTHISLVVTVILTIILGAAAGTVAFLLLPK